MAALKKHPEIVIADRRFAGFQEDKAKAVMTDLVRRFSPGEIRAVVAQSDEMAVPAAEVVQAEGWKDVLIFGFDGSRSAFDAIRKGDSRPRSFKIPSNKQKGRRDHGDVPSGRKARPGSCHSTTFDYKLKCRQV